jgi:hypothetical protein
MATPFTPRQEAEAIEQFGDDLAALCRSLDDKCKRLSPAAIERINAIPHQDHLDTVAEAFRKLGDEMCAKLDAADEGAD